jgi:hypothetical protein
MPPTGFSFAAAALNLKRNKTSENRHYLGKPGSI